MILVLRFGPQMYFAKDSESMLDFDDEVDSEMDWESDLSSEFTHTDDDHDDKYPEYPNGLKQHHESTEWGRNIYEKGPNCDNFNVQGNTNTEHDLRMHPRTNSSLSRHASAPDILSMTYEVPIVDHSCEKDKGSLSTRKPSRRGKGANLKPIFHG